MVNGRVKTGDFLIHGTSKEMTLVGFIFFWT